MASTRAGDGRGQESQGPLEASGRQPETRVKEPRDFFYFFRRNPLKSPDSTKGIQGNPRTFPCFYLDFLASNSRCGCAGGLLGARRLRLGARRSAYSSSSLSQ